MSNTTFKEFDVNNDIINVQRLERSKLFYSSYGIHKPFNASNNLDVVLTSTESVIIEDPEVFSSIGYLNNSGSGITYFAWMRGRKYDYDTSTGSGIVYHSMVNLTQNSTGSYRINNTVVNTETERFDVLSLSREWYYDGVDIEYFGIQIFTGSSNESTTRTEYSLNNGTLGLYPFLRKFDSKIGDKYYLYPVSSSLASSTVLYNSSTDVLTIPDSEYLNLNKPYGEIFPSNGLIIIYVDKIFADYPSFNRGGTISTLAQYMGAVVGRSLVQYNSTIYFSRVRNDEFNYSTNPTYYADKESGIVKPEFVQNPVVFHTTIGYYNANNELVAVGRFNSPIEKSPIEELVIRSEISY